MPHDHSHKLTPFELAEAEATCDVTDVDATTSASWRVAQPRCRCTRPPPTPSSPTRTATATSATPSPLGRRPRRGAPRCGGARPLASPPHGDHAPRHRVRRHARSPAGRGSRASGRCRARSSVRWRVVLREPVALTVAGPHRPRRARARAGRLVRGRAGRRRSLNAVLDDDVAVLASAAAARRLRRPRRRALARRTATACCTAASARPSSAAARCGGRTASTATRCTRAPRLLRGHARLHRVHADRDRPRALRARRLRRALGVATATSSSSASRPTRSCAT